MADFDKININSASYNVKDTQVREDLAAEISARKQADTELQVADTHLQSAINAEGTARQQADNKLQTAIDNIKTSPLFNVKDYGAVGNGTADDSTAIQSAMDAAMENGGGTVIFPAGNYLVGTTLIIRPHTASQNPESTPSINFLPMDRINLIGLGKSRIVAGGSISTILQTTDFSYPGNVGSYSNFYTTISNLMFIGTGSTTTGLDIYNALHSILDNVQVDGCNTALSIRGYGEATVKDCTLRANTVCIYTNHAGDNLFIGNDFYTDSVCIQTYGYSGSTKIIANTFTRNTSAAQSATGVQILTAENEQNGPYHIIANSFDQMRTCVDSYGTESNHNFGVYIINNKVSSGGVTQTVLANLTYTDNSVISNNSLSLASFYDSIYALCYLTNCTNINVTNNFVSGMTNTAIYVTNSSGAIAYNYFASGALAYISTSGACAGLSICFNVFVEQGSNNAIQLGSDSVAALRVFNNTFIGYSSNEVNNAGSATVNTSSFSVNGG